ncbi:glycosyltransferase family 9 protein [Celerinatantimonas yamalensis]|uniref:Glycosyltransferase family 9 protein n=2 Tax=Celerinatantimonas yamalensis TaxID=559956 RepID=A0ABW9G6T3_9GAMM
MQRIRNVARRFDQYRRRHSHLLEGLVYKLLAMIAPATKTHFDPQQLDSILVIRSNKRLGNVLFLLPFLKALRQQYPMAKIELLVARSWQAELFCGCALDAVHVSNFSFRHLLKWCRLLGRLRQTHYDMVVMPFRSSSDTLTAAFLHSHYKVAYHHPLHQSIFRHSVSSAQRLEHAAFSALKLLNLPDAPFQWPFTQEELELLRRHNLAKNRYRIGFFRGARGEKILPKSYWQQLVESPLLQRADIEWVEILAPEAIDGLSINHTWLKCLSLRELAMHLAELDLFVSADTGPLHLADAVGAPCIGLFSHTDPVIYGCLNVHSTNLVDTSEAPNLAAEQIAQHIQRLSSSYAA